jgi:hypothetical protein
MRKEICKKESKTKNEENDERKDKSLEMKDIKNKM